MSLAAGMDRAMTDAAVTPPWRILLVDDCADDAELVCLELAKGGVDAECRRVDSERELLEALPSFSPHLVLSDLNMPGFSGQRAIELVRAHAPAARFAFLSGEPADGEAPEARLSKDNLAQLPALVRRLLGG